MINRVASLEARASLRSSTGQLIYLPVIFFLYGFLLGMFVCCILQFPDTPGTVVEIRVRNWLVIFLKIRHFVGY